MACAEVVPPCLRVEFSGSPIQRETFEVFLHEYATFKYWWYAFGASCVGRWQCRNGNGQMEIPLSGHLRTWMQTVFLLTLEST